MDNAISLLNIKKQLLLPNFRAVENNNIRLGRESTFEWIYLDEKIFI